MYTLGGKIIAQTCDNLAGGLILSTYNVSAEATSTDMQSQNARVSEVRNIEKRIRMMSKMGATPRIIRDSLLRSNGIDLSQDVIRGIVENNIPSIHLWQFKKLHHAYIVLFIEKFLFRVKKRKGTSVKEAYLLTGVDLDGNDDILGVWVTEKASQQFWFAVMADLRTRGIEEILLVCTDCFEELQVAMADSFPFTEMQQPVTHYIYSSVSHISLEDKKRFTWELSQIYTATDETEALNAFTQLEHNWNEKYPLALQVWRAGWSDVQTFFAYPAPLREIMYSNWVSKYCHRKLSSISKIDPLFVSDLSLLNTMYLVSQDAIRKPKTNSQHWVQNLLYIY